MKPIRASEIGTFLYCARAWWYQQRGVPSSNLAALAAGSELHRRHGNAVLAAGLTRYLGLGLLLAALMILAATCTGSLFP
jgi:CRISPR/Cas system-associated exonuclease Cas4 (RecB family)